jgi:hypothetical protein
MRPFQAPPKVIDCTKDALFELHWQSIPKSYKRDISKEDPDAIYEYRWSRRELDATLFDQFQSQGERLYQFSQ